MKRPGAADLSQPGAPAGTVAAHRWRRRLLTLPLTAAAIAPFAWLSACSSEALVRVPGTVFGAPAEVALWGLDQAAAETLAQQVWQQLTALDQAWQQRDPPLLAQLAAPAGLATSWMPDLALRGLALDRIAPLLQVPELQGSLLTLGQHLLALGQRGFRDWHVGVPDPQDGLPLAHFDLYDSERLATVSSYARYRPGAGQPLAPAPAGAAACACCAVVLRGQGVLAARQAAALYQAPQADWPAMARTLGASQVLWVGRNGALEATPLLARRLQLKDSRRKLTERAA